MAVGTTGMVIIGLCAILKSVGALGGWMLLVSQSAKAAADDGMFPSIFGRINRYGVPGVGLVVVSVLMTLILFATISPTIAGQFDRIINLAVILIVVPGQTSSVAVVRVVFDRVGRGRTLSFFRSLHWRPSVIVFGQSSEATQRQLCLGALLLSVPLYLILYVLDGGSRQTQTEDVCGAGFVTTVPELVRAQCYCDAPISDLPGYLVPVAFSDSECLSIESDIIYAQLERVAHVKPESSVLSERYKMTRFQFLPDVLRCLTLLCIRTQ